MAVFSEVTVLVDGAVDECAVFFDYALEAAFIEDVKEEAEGHGYPTKIHVLYHDFHDFDVECECAQYETDHRPVWDSELDGFDNEEDGS